jgi:ankyrin repeat protein
LFGRYCTETADIKAIPSYKQSTPLQAAAQEGHDNVVDILLEAGARASDIRHDGKTAHELAKERGHHGIVRRLEQALEEERVVLRNSINPIAINAFMGKE